MASAVPFAFSAPAASVTALGPDTAIDDFNDADENASLGAIILQPPSRQANAAVAKYYKGLALFSEEELEPVLELFNSAIKTEPFTGPAAKVAIAFILGYEFVIDESGSRQKIQIIDRKRWSPRQASEMVGWLLTAYSDARGAALDTAFDNFSLKDKRSLAIAIRSENCSGQTAGPEALSQRADNEQARLQLWALLEASGFIKPASSQAATPADRLSDLLAVITSDGAAGARRAVLLQIPAVLKSMVLAGYDPALHPDFNQLPPPLRKSLCEAAEIPMQVSDPAEQFKTLRRVPHPSFGGLDALKSAPDSLFEQAKNSMGGASAHHKTFGSNPAGTNDSWLGPDVPRPTRHILTYNPNDITTCPMANDFLTDPTPQQRQSRLAASDLTMTTDGSFRIKAATVTSPELKDASDLQRGAHRMGAYCVAAGIMSIEVRLAHDKFIYFIVDLHQKYNRPWKLIRTVYKKFMEEMHTGVIASFGDRDALARLMTFHQMTSGQNNTGDSQEEKKRKQRQRETDKKAAAEKKKLKARATGDDDSGGGGKKKKRWQLLDPLEVNGEKICFDHQIGRCKYKDDCRRLHVCGVCGEGGHKAPDCPQNK